MENTKQMGAKAERIDLHYLENNFYINNTYKMKWLPIGAELPLIYRILYYLILSNRRISMIIPHNVGFTCIHAKETKQV